MPISPGLCALKGPITAGLTDCKRARGYYPRNDELMTFKSIYSKETIGDAARCASLLSGSFLPEHFSVREAIFYKAY